MDKTRSLLNLFCTGLLIFLAGCASVPKPQEPEEPEIEIQDPKQGSKWEAVSNISQLTGLWIADDGSLYEWPLELNGKTYLRYAWAETDDTERWVAYAKLHNRDFMDVWSHRFSYISAIYGKDYPLSDANGTQTGLKFRTDYSSPYSKDIPFRIYRQQEFLMPAAIAEKNLSFFTISGKNLIKESGTLNFHSNVFNSLDADDNIYRLSRDYWKE